MELGNQGVKMRLDYTMYILAILLLAITFLPFIVQIEGVDDNTRTIWILITVLMAGLSFGLGYSQRPKTKAQACQ